MYQPIRGWGKRLPDKHKRGRGHFEILVPVKCRGIPFKGFREVQHVKR